MKSALYKITWFFDEIICLGERGLRRIGALFVFILLAVCLLMTTTRLFISELDEQAAWWIIGYFDICLFGFGFFCYMIGKCDFYSVICRENEKDFIVRIHKDVAMQCAQDCGVYDPVKLMQFSPQVASWLCQQGLIKIGVQADNNYCAFLNPDVFGGEFKDCIKRESVH